MEKFIADRWTTIIILGILAMGIWFRATIYGDLRLSAGMSDTPSYINSSRAKLFSPQMFSGERLFTTNLLYKLANDPIRCPLTIIGNPSVGIELPRDIQPCFDKIAVLQNRLY